MNANEQEKLKFADVIMKALEANDGYASLDAIYRRYHSEFAPKFGSRGATPEASIRTETQRAVKRGDLKRIGLGIYALPTAQLPTAPPAKTKVEKAERRHSQIQGMLLEIGNHRDENECANTYTPDKNSVFGNKLLGKLATLEKIHEFTFPQIVREIRRADVIWFNKRDFPHKIFEVEHTTNFKNALLKFCELQDFKVRFYCVAEANRENKFREALGKSTFAPIRENCEFISYEKIESDYANALRETYI